MKSLSLTHRTRTAWVWEAFVSGNCLIIGLIVLSIYYHSAKHIGLMSQALLQFSQMDTH